MGAGAILGAQSPADQTGCGCMDVETWTWKTVNPIKLFCRSGNRLGPFTQRHPVEDCPGMDTLKYTLVFVFLLLSSVLELDTLIVGRGTDHILVMCWFLPSNIKAK